jgi:Domain of unknown function (DUF4287)
LVSRTRAAEIRERESRLAGREEERMTEDKARKRDIRKRMAKTGERYTTARRHTVTSKLPDRVADPGMSEQAVRRGTGRSWDEWFRTLDAAGAAHFTHRQIAQYLHDEHGVPGWWAQMVTVGYERARGMRAVHQAEGGFQVSVSRTFPVGVWRLFQTFEDSDRRRRWLEPGTLRVRTSQPRKSARFDFRGGPSRVQAYFESKGRDKSTITVQHERLPDADAVEDMRAFWKERLTRLGKTLA